MGQDRYDYNNDEQRERQDELPARPGETFGTDLRPIASLIRGVALFGALPDSPHHGARQQKQQDKDEGQRPTVLAQQFPGAH